MHFASSSTESPVSRVVWWLLGIITAALVTAASAWVASTDKKVNSNTTNIAVINEKLDHIGATVDKIEVKVDGLTVKVKH